MKNRLIIVEGLPTSGKSTTAKYIAGKLNYKFFDESDELHPADYINSAYIMESQLGNFSSQEQDLIISKSIKREDGYIVSLKEFKGELFEKIIQYKIYDFLPWDIERKLFLGKWQEFMDNLSSNCVFNCTFLQNPMCEAMIRFGFSLDDTFQYIKEIYNIIKPLNPIIIYLKVDNIGESIRRVVPERGSGWLNAVIDYHCNGAYGKENKLEGFDGYIKALEERQRREIYILKHLGVKHIILENANINWNQTYKTIDDYIHNNISEDEI